MSLDFCDVQIVHKLADIIARRDVRWQLSVWNQQTLHIAIQLCRKRCKIPPNLILFTYYM